MINTSAATTATATATTATVTKYNTKSGLKKDQPAIMGKPVQPAIMGKPVALAIFYTNICRALRLLYRKQSSRYR